jgi:hypothetical protein
MTISDILRNLPESITWLVLFEIKGFRAIASDDVMKDMYFLNKSVELDKFDYVILTSQGRYLSSASSSVFTHGETLEPYSFQGENNLFNAYADLLHNYEVNDAQSFAVAIDPDFGKVLLYIQLKDGLAHSEGLFTFRPTQFLYELLQSVGVRYVGGVQHEGHFRAKYINRLSVHISSGTINDYSRTDNCNVFFFRHGQIDEFLKSGLFTAADKRIEITRRMVSNDLKEVATKCLNEKLAMSWLPPTGDETFPFGDLVPKGYVNRALKETGEQDIQPALERDIISKKLRGLWTFETDDLETSIDSALVLQSLTDAGAARQLDQFFDGEKGLYPQLWAVDPKPGEMIYDPRKRHWCQADAATTALVVALQKRHGLAVDARMEQYVRTSFDTRSDLYLANPYMVDWIYAQALMRMDGTEQLREQLKQELLQSLNADFSFGQFDKVLSSAFGAMALLALGYRGNVVMALQLFIINNYHREKNGKNVPYYSSLINDDGHTEGRTVKVNGYTLDLSLHEDTYNMIYISMVALALNERIGINDLTEETLLYIEAVAHPRYGAASVKEYVEQVALVPYMKPGLPLQ